MIEITSTDPNPLGSDPIALSFDDLRQACDTAILSLKRDFGWADEDKRIEGIHRLRNVFQSTLALFVFHRTIFPSVSFWKTFFVAAPTEIEFANYARECDVLLRFAALHGQFSALESVLRLVVNALDPNACAGGTAQFDSIARWLLARLVTAQPYEDFIELLRLTRNTIHNNGVHRPPSGNPATVAYRGKSYVFTVNQPVEFVDWSFVITVAQGVLQLFQAIVRDSLVAKLPNV